MSASFWSAFSIEHNFSLHLLDIARNRLAVRRNTSPSGLSVLSIPATENTCQHILSALLRAS